MAAPLSGQRLRGQAGHRATLAFGNEGLLDLRIGVIAVTVALIFSVLSIFPASVAFAWILLRSIGTVSHSIAEYSRASATANGRGRCR